MGHEAKRNIIVDLLQRFDRKKTSKPAENDRANKNPNISAQKSSETVEGPRESRKSPGHERHERRVGDYVLKKTIGQGTFGKVKLAEHMHTKEKVAVKIIEKANVKTAKQRNSVQREVRLMRLLHHPHIVDVMDILENDTHIFMIMEYAHGGELFDYIVNRGKLSEKESRHFFRQILSAVGYCHMNSVIHRDLKPENLLLTHDKNIKIIDFGFGNTFHRDKTLDTYCGSPFYAAPEMIKGVRYTGPEVDVWSLGVILYALLEGKLPFDANSMTELYDRISKGVYDTPPGFSQGAAHLVSRMLTVDPIARAQLEEVMYHP
ncbi:kinase-like domain-containing protein [Cladochytrium replicatum]|nr:kinase-like domain-containing protein [Cladochytrium replicatum]